MRVRINDTGNVFFLTAREEEAEQLLRARMAKPLGRPGKKVRCLQLSCSRKQAHTFLRGERWSTSQASKTFKLARVGPQRMPVYEHLERSFGFSGTDSLPIATGSNGNGHGEPDEEPACEQLRAVDNSCLQAETEIAVHPEERGSDAEREPERVPVEPETPDIAVPAKQSHDTTIPADPSDITGQRRLAQAVILQAIEDRATHWFSSSYAKQSFEFWCAVGGWILVESGRGQQNTR